MTNLLWKLVFQPLSGRVYVNLLEGNMSSIVHDIPSKKSSNNIICLMTPEAVLIISEPYEGFLKWGYPQIIHLQMGLSMK